MRVVIGVSGGEARPSGHSLRLLLSGGDPRVETVMGGGLCVYPRSRVTHIGLGSHSGPTLHPEGGQESQPHPWHGEAGFPGGHTCRPGMLPRRGLFHSSLTLWRGFCRMWWPHPRIVQMTRGHFCGSLDMKCVQEPRHIGGRGEAGASTRKPAAVSSDSGAASEPAPGPFPLLSKPASVSAGTDGGLFGLLKCW